MKHLETLAKIAINAALEAGKVINSFYGKPLNIEYKTSEKHTRSQVLTQADKESEQIIINYLKPSCEKYNIGLLSEERPDDGSRFKKDFFWCIDPLDGTLAFVKKQSGFSISIALIAKNGTPLIGVVLNPITKDIYYAIKDKGAFKNNVLWKLKPLQNHLTYVTDKSLSNTPNKELIKKIISKEINHFNLESYKEINGAGSVLNAILVAENRPGLLLKLPKKELGGGCIWDFAATICIFNELGLVAKTYANQNIQLNPKKSFYMNTEGIFYKSF